MQRYWVFGIGYLVLGIWTKVLFMNTISKYKEWVIIGVVWLLAYAYDPLYMKYAEMASQFDFQWAKVFSMWTYTTAFLLLFLLHHFVLVPRLAIKKHKWQYVAAAVACIIIFLIFLIMKAESRPLRGPLEKEPPLLSPPDLARLFIAILLLVADLGAVAWLNEQKLRQRLLQLEKQNLKQELEHLRYQINPHFFMNTLNNIHALVDIDQEQAKRSIIELSGLMRYSLYNDGDTMAPLQSEVEFLKQYISLMRLRYNNKVELLIDLPHALPSEVKIPPLLLATFVENAFKHGISYQHPSYINIRLVIEEEGHIHFHCANSRHVTTPSAHDTHHGIGLVNVRKRLDLQYQDRYRLTINHHTDGEFLVDLLLPTSMRGQLYEQKDL